MSFARARWNIPAYTALLLLTAACSGQAGPASEPPPGESSEAMSLINTCRIFKWSAPDGTPCNDRDPCTQGEACKAGVCTGGIPVRIDDGSSCTADSCDTALGVQHTPLADGTPCFDGTQTLTCAAGACVGSPVVAAPQLYADSRHESPVRGDPGDLLMMAGTGFDDATVAVYRKVDDTTQPLVAPSTMPVGRTAITGVLDGSPGANLWRGEYSLKLQLPPALTPGQSYALWAAKADPANPGQYLYSNGVMINDARPMWVSPGPRTTAPATVYPYAFTTAPRPGIGRTLEIVGKNLQPMPGLRTQVRFTAAGLPGFTLTAADDSDSSTQIERYAAVLTLPESVPLAGGQATDYTMTLSRDGGLSWVPVPTRLTVLPDPPAAATFHPDDYGDATVSCDPCGGGDNTLCIARAIHAAGEHVASAGTPANVVLGGGACGNGVWHLATACQNGGGDIEDAYFTTAHPGQPLDAQPYTACTLFWGIPVPPGVNIVADPGMPTRPIVETDQGFDQPVFDWYGAGTDPLSHRQNVFMLEGDNVVKGLHFRDVFQSAIPGPGARSVTIAGHDITVTGNFFDGTYAAVDIRYVPVAPDGLAANVGLIMTDNKIGAWWAGLSASRLEDSVVSGNTFWPGGQEAPIAAGASGGARVNVSANVIDGDVTTYSASTNQYGWRAGLFFPTFTPQEDVLVAQNQIKCTGTRAGNDGEAISFDSNGAHPAFRWSEEVVDSASSGGSPSTSQVTVAWPDACIWTTSGDAQNLVGTWLQVDYGPGLGQTRKITGVSTTATTITLTVSPAFDVLPIPGSRVIAGNQVWQANIVDNQIDNTCPNIPPAVWSGAIAPGVHYGSAGLLEIYSTAADVTMDANKSTNAAGIAAFAQYWDESSTGAGAATQSSYQTPVYFVDLRSNTMTGQFGGASNASNHYGSGIIGYTISTIETSINGPGLPDDPNYPGFGLTVAHNTLSDALLSSPNWGWAQSAGIWLSPMNDPGESPTPGYLDTLIFDNQVGTTAPMSGAVCTDGVQSTSYLNGTYESAVSVGASYTGAPGGLNYPAGTVLCGNTATNLACLYTDWPGAGEVSSVVQCQ